MSSSLSALQLLDAVEQAVADGDLQRANEQADQLRPLLASAGIDEMLALRDRVAALKLQVIDQKDKHAHALRQFNHQREGVQAYQKIAGALGS